MNDRASEAAGCGSELARDSVHPARGYASLRLGRWSAAGATYFVTFCTAERKTSLVAPEIIAALTKERASMEADHAWLVRAWVVMPDHVHVLFEPCDRLPLARSVARFKSKTSGVLKTHGVAWQSGYFDHRLRTVDELRPVLYYMLMNPVHADLSARGDDWVGFYCSADDWMWFGDYAREAVVAPAWIGSADHVASKLAPTDNRAAT